ncbi:MAG: 3-dehydroquinate synthase [Candidatus Aminicenantales bacterium]
MNIVLTGMMGVGKTVVGKKLAQKLGFDFVDTDELIERQTRFKISEIFIRFGESHFRNLEKRICYELCQRKNIVVSTGGKTLLNTANLNLLSSSFLIFSLLCRPEKILQRIQNEVLYRPLLAFQPKNNLFQIYQKRKNQYLNLPNPIDTTYLTEDEVVKVILKKLRGKKNIFDDLIDGKKSTVFFHKGILGSISEYLSFSGHNRKIFLLSDEKVFSLYGEKLKQELKRTRFTVSIFLLPPGEKQKNLKNVGKIYSWLASQRADRGTALICLGGGTISDLGGFAASTFQRGINLIYLPTTLLSQIDACIGGKNGVNFMGAKNQIGTFYFPRLVLIDPLFLTTLNLLRMKEGLIEGLKAGIVADEELFALIKNSHHKLLKKDLYLLEKFIIRSVKVKLAIVCRDPYEKNQRKILNFGHTFGHALEAQSQYRISHGKAVALGMICASRLGTLLHISSSYILDELQRILRNMQISTRRKKLDIPKILSFMEYDKKRRAGKTSFIVPQKIGRVIIKENVRQKNILESLREIGHEKETIGH